MAFVTINPRFRDLLERHGLTSAGSLVALPGLIVSGHPGRNVARVTIGDTIAYLKREHRVQWRDRLRSAVAGFGFASLAVREARVLAALHAAGIPCPEWIAAGEDDHGRAFLLLALLPGTVDLREFLQENRGATPGERYRFSRRLGATLAAIHNAGFDHPDLYAKHVLVAPATGQCYFLDWQRSRPRRLRWRQRAHDLAALDATLADHVATLGERLACLRGYLAASGLATDSCWVPCFRGPSLAGYNAPNSRGRESMPLPTRRFAEEVRRQAARLLRYRHVRKERASPPPATAQGVYWLDGEALCLTRDYWDELQGEVPSWLPLSEVAHGSSQSAVTLSGGRRGWLVRSCRDRPLLWLWCLFRRRPLLSSELRQAGALFRLQKHGQAAPRVLAFGQCRPRPWRTQSFLLTEIEADQEGRRS
jgi:tRNA A-37 threonylcarbamoyl transferase component Bud32